jgi:hypothetical protein
LTTVIITPDSIALPLSDRRPYNWVSASSSRDWHFPPARLINKLGCGIGAEVCPIITSPGWYNNESTAIVRAYFADCYVYFKQKQTNNQAFGGGATQAAVEAEQWPHYNEGHDNAHNRQCTGMGEA